jgi:predicted dehydrogenase
MGYLGAKAAANTRTPAGHPEGYLEAFANIYRHFANHLRAVIDGTTPDPNSLDYPKLEDGIRGMAFIEAVVESSHHNARWTRLEAR